MWKPWSQPCWRSADHETREQIGRPPNRRRAGTLRTHHRRSFRMRALVWHGKQDIRCDTVPDPKIEAPRDAIIKVTTCAICGSDLHLYDGFMPGMENGDIMGHEFMGEVVEVGP